MRFFQHIISGIDIGPLLHQVQTNPELWNVNRIRTTFANTPHAAVDDILLRFNAYNPDADDVFDKVVDSSDCVNYPPFSQLTHSVPIVFALMARVHGERLGRVMITRLPPGATITPHADQGAPATYYERYQLTLQAQTGVVFRAGDEQVFMEPGSVWWFDNQAVHTVENHSPEDRIVMIMDIRPFRAALA